MADTARILLNKPLDIKCPACGQELIMIIAIQVNGSDGVDSVSYGDEALNGGRKATVQLGGTVTGTKLDHDCLPKATRGRPAETVEVGKVKGDA